MKRKKQDDTYGKEPFLSLKRKKTLGKRKKQDDTYGKEKRNCKKTGKKFRK
ncbi:MAG: hypothetical protein ABIH83_02220 [Candidatus Micrarchaeota archaeon]